MSEMPPSYTPPPPGGGYTPPPPPPPAGGAPGSDRGVMIFLSYFGLFALIPLLMKKEDPDIQWHSKNGLALAIGYVAAWIGVTIISVVMPGPLKLIVFPLYCVIGIGYIVVDIMAMVKAFGNQRMRIPVVTDMAEKMFGA